MVPHNPLDILPVPANSVFCKACSTVHSTRVQLCPAFRLDICPIHKTVLVPHEKSFYFNSHLQDIDTECPDCIYGSEKKLNHALSRSKSRALRAAVTHKDVVFCVYCWAPATKKCSHLASCREHSCLYLRSQIDINSKWWLRPSDFACHLCPLNGVMPKKAQEWRKNYASAPSAANFGDIWDEWRSCIEGQITRLHPGAFQSWAARCEYVTWMNGMGKNEMLYLRYLAYGGAHPIIIIYAETGTIPKTIQYPQPVQSTCAEAPPPYTIAQPASEIQERRAPEQGSRIPSEPWPCAQVPVHTPVTSEEQPLAAAPPIINQLQRFATLIEHGQHHGPHGIPKSRDADPPRPTQVQSMYSSASIQPISQMRAPQFQTIHVSHPPQIPRSTLTYPSSTQDPTAHASAQPQNRFYNQPMQPHISHRHQSQLTTNQHFHQVDLPSYQLPPTLPGPQQASDHQHQSPTNLAPVVHSPIIPTTSHTTPTIPMNPEVARYLEQLHMPRTSIRHFQSNRISTLPESYPGSYSPDDDWETITDMSEEEAPSMVPMMPPASLFRHPTYHVGLNSQGTANKIIDHRGTHVRHGLMMHRPVNEP